VEYDHLEAAYWQAQIERVERLRQKITSRAITPVGRIIPDDEDLTIGTGRRLNVTVMFIDISEFSKRPSSTAQEQELMLRVLNLFMTAMIRIVEDYEGNVEKNTGDGLMAYFENSEAANATQKAVACSLTMQAANEYLISPVLRATGVQPLGFRVSMDHGPLTIARIGAARRFNANVAIGNTANFASKVLHHVKAGEIGLGGNAQSTLPEMWRLLWTELSPISTGWSYGNTITPYPLYLYTGRWATTL
jgi:adenylate cyclase